MIWRIVVSTAWFMMLTAVPTFACPVCGAGGNEENGAVYLAMSAVLSGLPLAMIGGIVFWLRRAARHGAGANHH
jgi:hypothetical protein